MSNKTDLLGAWIRRFLLEHLVAERNLSRNAQRSYRDAFAQLMPFVSRQGRMAVDRVAFDDLSPDRLRSFLAYLETERQCTMRSAEPASCRHSRLRPLCRQPRPRSHRLVLDDPDRPVQAISSPGMCYLDKPEIDALIAAPDLTRQTGRRDHAMLLFLYNTGARASEAVAVTLGDIEYRPDGTGSCASLAREAKPDLVHSGRPRLKSSKS